MRPLPSRRLIIFLIFLFLPVTLLAQTTEERQQQLTERRRQIKVLEDEIDLYKKNIEVKQKEAATLRGQLDILKSRVEKTSLEILVTEAKIAEFNLLIKSLTEEILLKEQKITEQKKLLAGLLKKFYLKKQKKYLDIILTDLSLADYFNDLRYLEDLSLKIDQALRGLKDNRRELEKKITELKNNQQRVADYQEQLTERQSPLTEQKQAKEILLRDARLSEVKFKALLEQLRAEYEDLNREALKLQREIEKALYGKEIGDSVLTWPVAGHNGISAYFHDPTYPFRYLFEHSGLDLRLPSGTPVQAAGAGYVAWAKTSRLYGNNVMIVHANNLVTLYAHLSGFKVQPNTFVERGQVIGFSGGLPGTPGAGFSTGAHLHFEVRLNGSPENPLNYVQ